MDVEEAGGGDGSRSEDRRHYPRAAPGSEHHSQVSQTRRSAPAKLIWVGSTPASSATFSICKRTRVAPLTAQARLRCGADIALEGEP